MIGIITGERAGYKTRNKSGFHQRVAHRCLLFHGSYRCSLAKLFDNVFAHCRTLMILACCVDLFLMALWFLHALSCFGFLLLVTAGAVCSQERVGICSP